MLWNQYLENTGHAIQKGLETGLHTIEAGLATYGTLRGAYELGVGAMPYIRAAASAAASAAPALALL